MVTITMDCTVIKDSNFLYRVQSSKQSDICPESHATSYTIDQHTTTNGNTIVEDNTPVPLLYETLRKNCHPESKKDEFAPAFPPGRVLHITVRETKSTNT